MGRMSLIELHLTVLSLAPVKLRATERSHQSNTQASLKFETRIRSDDTLTATSDEVSRAEVCWETPIASKPI